MLLVVVLDFVIEFLESCFFFLSHNQSLLNDEIYIGQFLQVGIFKTSLHLEHEKDSWQNSQYSYNF